MVDKFDSHITIERSGKAKDVDEFRFKDILIDSQRVRFSTPFKSMDMDGLARSTLTSYQKRKEPFILEKPVYINEARSYNAIHEVNEGFNNDTSRLIKLLGICPGLYNEIPKAIAFPSVVFHRNPFEKRIVKAKNGEIKEYPPFNRDNFNTFLQNIYSYSNGMVLVPDIKITRISKLPPAHPTSYLSIGENEYLKLIGEFTDVMTSRNNKPVFVPIQVQMTQKSTRNILEHYKKEGYSNFWINFGGGEFFGKPLSGFRMILDTLDKLYGIDEYVVYCSHMAKEKSPDIRDSKTVPSDMLSPFFGADVVGVNYEIVHKPQDTDGMDEYIRKQGFDSKAEYDQSRLLHKNRIFDPESYYYYNVETHPLLSAKPDVIKQILAEKSISRTVDNTYRFDEIENVKAVLDTEKKIKPYIKSKQMFKKEHDVLEEISGEGEKTTSLFNF